MIAIVPIFPFDGKLWPGGKAGSTTGILDMLQAGDSADAQELAWINRAFR